MHGNGETPEVSARRIADRLGKALGRKSNMYASGRLGEGVAASGPLFAHTRKKAASHELLGNTYGLRHKAVSGALSSGASLAFSFPQ